MTELTSSAFLKSKAKAKRRRKENAGMKNKRVLKIILTVLILFFGFRFLSDIFFSMGENTGDEGASRNSYFLKLSTLFFPFDAESLCDYGFELLKQNGQSPDPRVLAKSISYFKRSLAVNMLYYHSHLNLGKAYFYRNKFDHTSFDQAIEAFKKAAGIRGSNARVSMDTLTVMLSMWPFLREEDKAFCIDLLGKSIKRFNREDFNFLLGIWGRYSKDVDFFKEALKKNPEYYLSAANKLSDLEINMEARHDFLEKYAGRIFNNIQRQYQRYIEEGPPDLLEKLKKLSVLLDRQPAAYYIVDPDNKLNRKAYFGLKKSIMLNILDLLFLKKDWQNHTGERSELESVILSYIDNVSTLDDLKAFDDFLARKKFFSLSGTDLRVFYIKQAINFKSGQYESVIGETEALRRSISFVKKEHVKDYSDILLLLTDAYISSRLLIRATAILKEVKEDDSNLTDIYWRKMQIEQVIGVDDEEDKNERKKKKEQYGSITASSFVELNSRRLKKTVYLIDNKKEVDIQFGDSLKGEIKSKPFHLLQVFIDGKLFHEAYLSKLKLPVKITIPTEERYTKHSLGINLL